MRAFRLLPLIPLLLAARPAAAGKPKLRTVRVLEWAQPMPPWQRTDYQLAASAGGVEVRITFLPAGGRAAFFLDKTGVADDPFANDPSTMLFQVEVVNTGTSTLSLSPEQFAIDAGIPDPPWHDEDYFLKFKGLGPTESERLRHLYLMKKVELPPGTRVNRLLVFNAQNLSREDGFLLTVQNLPIVSPDGRAIAVFRMIYAKRKMDAAGNLMPPKRK